MVFMQLQRLLPSTIQLHHGDIGIAVHQVRSQFCGDLRYSSFMYPNVALNGANAIIPKVPGRRRVLAHLVDDVDLCGQNFRLVVTLKVNLCNRRGPFCLPALPRRLRSFQLTLTMAPAAESGQA